MICIVKETSLHLLLVSSSELCICDSLFLLAYANYAADDCEPAWCQIIAHGV